MQLELLIRGRVVVIIIHNPHDNRNLFAPGKILVSKWLLSWFLSEVASLWLQMELHIEGLVVRNRPLQ